MKHALILLCLMLSASISEAGVILKKWSFGRHAWCYVGEYRCNHLGEIKFFSNSEINRWRVSHYNEHQRFDNFTRLFVLVGDTYFYAYSIESVGRGRINFESNARLQAFLSNLTS